jgi:hypothetical protein
VNIKLPKPLKSQGWPNFQPCWLSKREEANTAAMASLSSGLAGLLSWPTATVDASMRRLAMAKPGAPSADAGLLFGTPEDDQRPVLLHLHLIQKVGGDSADVCIVVPSTTSTIATSRSITSRGTLF